MLGVVLNSAVAPATCPVFVLDSMAIQMYLYMRRGNPISYSVQVFAHEVQDIKLKLYLPFGGITFAK